MAFRRSYRSAKWAQWHESNLRRQRQEFGGIDDDVREAFLALPEHRLNEFLIHYERCHGKSARSYAEKAIVKWRTGNVRISAQTTERLLRILPPFLGSQVKYDLLRKLRERYQLKESLSLEVTTLSYHALLLPLLERLISKAYSANLPADIETRLAWLSDGDVVAVKALLAGAEARAVETSTALLKQEFFQIERLLAASSGVRVMHSIELPYGVIRLRIKRGKDMDQEKGEIIPPRNVDLPGNGTSDGLLRNAIRNLDPAQLSDVLKRAADEDLASQIAAQQSDQRFLNASRDMDNLVSTARRVEGTTADYKLSGNFNTASGTTSVHMERDRSRTWIFVVIALVVLVLLLIARR